MRGVPPVWSFLGFVFIAMLGCSQEVSSAERGIKANIYLEINDLLPKYDMYFTWEDYDPDDVPNWQFAEENVQYLLDGIPVGRGRIGFGRIIQRISDMPRESRILVYPSYDLPEVMNIDSGPLRDYPFMNYSTLLWETLIDRHDIIIFSPRDVTGNVHPQCMKIYQRFWPSSLPASQP